MLEQIPQQTTVEDTKSPEDKERESLIEELRRLFTIHDSLLNFEQNGAKDGRIINQYSLEFLENDAKTEPIERLQREVIVEKERIKIMQDRIVRWLTYIGFDSNLDPYEGFDKQ